MIFSIVQRVYVLYIMYLYDTSKCKLFNIFETFEYFDHSRDRNWTHVKAIWTQLRWSLIFPIHFFSIGIENLLTTLFFIVI